MSSGEAGNPLTDFAASSDFPAISRSWWAAGAGEPCAHERGCGLLRRGVVLGCVSPRSYCFLARSVFHSRRGGAPLRPLGEQSARWRTPLRSTERSGTTQGSIMTFESVPMEIGFHGHREAFQPPLEGPGNLAGGLGGEIATPRWIAARNDTCADMMPISARGQQVRQRAVRASPPEAGEAECSPDACPARESGNAAQSRHLRALHLLRRSPRRAPLAGARTRPREVSGHPGPACPELVGWVEGRRVPKNPADIASGM
jgi:hypothetical protein